MTTSHNFVAFLALTADLPTQYVLQMAHHPGFKLSQCANDIFGLINSEQASHDDLAAFYAPGECHDAVTRRTDKYLLAILSNHGYTAKSFINELVERTSEGWVRRSAIGHRVYEAAQFAGTRSNRARA